jgi:glutathione S-transferase
MKVLGRKTSGNVQKVLFLLEELGVDYVREDYGRQFGNTGDAAYLSLNPNGKVPTVIDGELAIWESNTILRYVAAKTGSALYPTDLAARTQVERWMDWLLASLNDSYVTIFKATKGGDAVPEGAAKTMVDCLKIMDGHLAKNTYLAGDAFTIADICLAPIVHRCINFPVALPELPALKGWHKRLSERPAFGKVVAA